MTERPRNPERATRLSALVESHADIVKRYLVNRHRTGDSLEPEDLLAEVFEVAWRRLDDIPSDAEIAWLIGVARNRLMNMRSKQFRRLSLSSKLKRSSSNAPAAEEEVVARISLMSAIDALPTTEREAFTLSVWEGLASRDLGIALGISENAAKVRLSRAKSLLLAQLNTDEADS